MFGLSKKTMLYFVCTFKWFARETLLKTFILIRLRGSHFKDTEAETILGYLQYPLKVCHMF